MRMAKLLQEAAAMDPDIPVELVTSTGHRIKGVVGPLDEVVPEMALISQEYLWDTEKGAYWVDPDKPPTWVRVDSIVSFRYVD